MRDHPTEESALLVEQVAAALADARQGESHAFEVALLAGLCERLPVRPAVLDEVDAWIDAEGADLLAGEIPRLDVDGRVDHLLALPDDAREERLDATFVLDEICAGLTFCGSESMADEGVEVVVRTIRSMPEPWQPMAPLASRILGRAPPLPNDPAGRLWRTVEAASWIAEMLARGRAVMPKGAFGVPRLDAPAPRARPQAATALPTEKAEVRLKLGDQGEITYVRTPTLGHLFIETAKEVHSIAAQRDGTPVMLKKQRSTTWTCPAEPGLYVLHLDGVPHVFEIG